MSGTVLETSLYVGMSFLQTLFPEGNVVSAEGLSVGKSLADLSEMRESSRALFGPKEDLLNQLESLQIDCAGANWDGYGAEAINEIAFIRAQAFIRALPDGVLLPEVSVEPDGAVSLDWMSGPYRMFSVSLEESGRIPYAWVDGADSGHAVTGSFGETVPERILEEIKRFEKDESTVRTA